MARILHIITGLGVGGAETMLYDLLAASSPAFDHSVFSLRASMPMARRIRELGVPVHTLDLKPLAPNPARIWNLRALTRQIAPDLIAGWMYHGNLMASFAGAGLPNVPVLWAIHSCLGEHDKHSWRTEVVIRLCARISLHPRAIIYPSDVARKQHELCGFHRDKSVVIANGINCDQFVPNPGARADVRRELSLDDTTILVGLVARCHPVKNQKGFLRAAAALVRSHSSARFLLVGRGVETDPSLRSLIQQLGLENRVTLFEERSDIARITAALDIACCPSSSESFSKAIGEAMACAVPCVVTTAGDPVNLVGDTGISVESAQPDALADALDQLIKAGGAWRRQLGVAARLRIQKNFSLPTIVAQYEEVYNRYLPTAPNGQNRETKNLNSPLHA